MSDRPNKLVNGEIVPLTDDEWAAYQAPPPPPTGDMINVERDRRIVAGKTFDVTGYGPVPLTGREKDKVALIGLLFKAQRARALGVTEAIIKLRDGLDVNHNLTPDQAIELINAGMSWIEATMAVSWDMKDGVAPFEAGIPADYSDDAYWP